jgi:hypothetical protein
MAEFNHKTFGRLVIKDLTQRDMENYIAAMKDKSELTMAEYEGQAVRASAKLGLIAEPKLTDDTVDALPRKKVKWIADKLANVIAEANRLDPE